LPLTNHAARLRGGGNSPRDPIAARILDEGRNAVWRPAIRGLDKLNNDICQVDAEVGGGRGVHVAAVCLEIDRADHPVGGARRGEDQRERDETEQANEAAPAIGNIFAAETERSPQ
jgi:hypothetical protein